MKHEWIYWLLLIPFVWGLFTEPLLTIVIYAIPLAICGIFFAAQAWLSKR